MEYPTYNLETKLSKNHRLIGGVDEAGRGPLAGPVVAACVILDSEKTKSQKTEKWLSMARDSKLMTSKQREAVADEIKKNAFCFGIGISSENHIDKINIHNASLRAMKLAVLWCADEPDFILVDGKFQIPEIKFSQQAIIKGDKNVLSISLASIIAKTTRDAIMRNWDVVYPEYGFRKHKGYPTQEHISMIKKYGPCPIHRKSFLKKIFQPN